MQFIVRINAEGAAFTGADDDYGPGPEVARILREIADKVDFPAEAARMLQLSGRVYDFNGQAASRWAFGTGAFDVDNAAMLADMPETF